MNIVPLCVILAAGEGSRMRPLTENRPKVMLPIAGKPLLEHLLTQCIEAGLKDFIFVIGYHEETVRKYFADGSTWGVKIRYVKQDPPAGTADALVQTQPLITGSFLFLNGDIMLKAHDIVPLIGSDDCMLTVMELEEVFGMGVVEIAGQRITRIHEKSKDPPTHLVNAGAYYFTPAIFASLKNTPRSSRGEYEITDTVQIMIDAGTFVGYRIVKTWRDVGYPWDLLAANESLLAEIHPQNRGLIEEGVSIQNNISIGEGTVVRAGSYIIGPVSIGKGCDIGPNCFIRPGTSIGDRCHIGASVEIKNSIIMSGSKIPHLSYIGDSVVGENCNFGAGTQVANLRLDRKNILINGRDTGRRKLGVVTGDHVSTGVNSSINPGTFIGSDVFIGPGAVASGNIVHGSRVT